MTTTVQKQVLINARALIADPDTGQGASLLATRPATLSHGRSLGYQVVRYGRDLPRRLRTRRRPKEATRIGKEVAKSIAPIWFCRSLMTMNDMRGHAAILARFDRALAAA